MDRLQQAAVLLDLAERLRAQGSWCGETHIQKAVYFLQELLHVPLGYEFVLHHYGPFSFDLRDELTRLQAAELVAVDPKPPYGSSRLVTDAGRTLRDKFPKTLAQYDDQLKYVVDHLSDKGVSELERLSTALFVLLEENEHSANRVGRLLQIKPHIAPAPAREAIERVQAMIADSPRVQQATA